MANIREYLPPVGQSQREVCQANTSQVTEWISATQSNAFAQISPFLGTSHAQDIKIPAFLRLQIYLSGNETLFPSEK